MLTIAKIITLAATNALNPCAFAVLTMVLFSIMAANPEKKHKVLMGGLYFSAAIFFGYFLYGLIIAQVFKSFLSFATSIYPYVSNTLATFAIIIGILNIKDFIRYQPGGLATEMPLIFRPLAKIYIKRITSPGSAFIIGIFVTLFLLPCTIAPYVIAFGSMTELSLLQTIPWLILYNLIFVLPMIALTLIVYFGVSEVEKLTNWKERNIRYIHLIIGILLIGLGIAIITKLI
jgi:cytochrome c biogenesis protein CcdA